MKTTTLIALSFALATLTACGAAAPKYGYTEADGPAKWGSLSPAWAMCEAGEQQSPIDISGIAGDPEAGPALAWTSTPGTIIDNGSAVQVNFAQGGSMTLGGTEYGLVQVHAHTHSEHTVDGKTMPLEMHFVHATPDGKLAVVGVMFAEGEAHPALAPIVAQMPTAVGKPAPLDAAIDPNGLLPADKTSIRYAGSLTTPPCSEGVEWTVMTTPLTASPEQIAAFTARYPLNARPVQPIKARTVRPAR